MRAELGPDLRPGAEQTGTDDDGVVLVRLGAGGVTAVRVDGPLSGSDALVAAVLAAYRQALLKRMAARRMRGEAEPPLPGLDDRWLAGVRAALDRLHRSGQEFRLDLRA